MASQLPFIFSKNRPKLLESSRAVAAWRGAIKGTKFCLPIILSAEPRTASGPVASAPDQGVREAFEHRDTMKTAQPSNAWMLTSTSRRLRDTEPRSAEPPPRSSSQFSRNPKPFILARLDAQISKKCRQKADPAQISNHTGARRHQQLQFLQSRKVTAQHLMPRRRRRPLGG